MLNRAWDGVHTFSALTVLPVSKLDQPVGASGLAPVSVQVMRVLCSWSGPGSARVAPRGPALFPLIQNREDLPPAGVRSHSVELCVRHRLPVLALLQVHMGREGATVRWALRERVEQGLVDGVRSAV